MIDNKMTASGRLETNPQALASWDDLCECYLLQGKEEEKILVETLPSGDTVWPFGVSQEFHSIVLVFAISAF